MAGCRLLLPVAGLLSAAAAVAASPESCGAASASSAPGAPRCASEEEASLLQARRVPSSTLPLSSPAVERISISNETFLRDGKQVLPLGANYVVKAQPYFPDLEVVRRSAKAFARQARLTTFKPSSGAEIVPVVRLGVMLEAAMPQGPGAIDDNFKQQLESVVSTFAEEGVYVFLDNHNDAFAGTNGGEGMPVWMTAKMQETDGTKDYITNPSRPLELSIPSFLSAIINQIQQVIPKIVIADKTDPWLNFSLGNDAGDPRFMAVGNINMRVNNDDKAWGAGTISLSKQMQNSCYRFFESYKKDADKEAFFEPYMQYIRYLTQVWDNHVNVIAVELFNEPPLCGLPDITKTFSSRNNLYKFYAAVLDELEADGTKAPIAFQDLGGSVFGAGVLITNIEKFKPVPDSVVDTLDAWAQKNQLIFSVHYYQNLYDQSSYQKFLNISRYNGKYLGTPVWLSEYWNPTVSETAQYMVDAVENGMDAVTYWQFAALGATNTDGWYIYPEYITEKGIPVDGDGNVNKEAWALYEQTVRAGTFWGADITGAEGAKEFLGLPMNQTMAARFHLEPMHQGRPPSDVFRCNKDLPE